MSFLENMNVNPGGLLNYSQLMQAQDSTEADKTEGDTQDKVEPDKNLEPPKGVVPYKMDGDTIEDTLEVDTDEKDDTGEPKTKVKDPEVYKAFLKAQADYLGIDIDLESFQGGAKEVAEHIHDIYSSMLDEEIEETKNTFFTPFQKRVLDMVQSGVPQEDAMTFFADVNKIESIDLEEMDDKTAKDAYRVFLKKTTKFSDTKIAEEIDELVELGSIKDKAKRVIPELKTALKEEETLRKEQAKQAEEARRQKEVESQVELKQFLDTTEEIGGIKLTKKMKDDWKKQYQLVANDKGQMVTPLQLKQSKDPVGFTALVNFLDSIGLFNYDGRKKQFTPDLKVLKTLSKNDVFDQVESAINKQKSKDAAGTGKNIEDMNFAPDKEEYMKKLLAVADKYK